ncbi:MAG: cytochrome c [Sandaracinaceae bacterium]|nr:cytochrome c [Sandaracinaceae bacterium]
MREWRATDHAQPSAGQPAPDAEEPAGEPSPEVLARAAAALWDVRCASCHGSTGDGAGAEAPTAEMPDFRTAAFQDGRTDADLSRAIRMGQGLMPAFGGQLNERGIDALVGHIRSLRPEG